MCAAYYQYATGRVAALERHDPFPDVHQALSEPNGLLAIGADLSPERLLQAYQLGIFPWFNANEPILWWSPSPRMVLFPNELKISHSLRKRLKKPDYEVRFNTAFAEVMQACASAQRPGQDGTWIHDDMLQAYYKLHQLGYAHSAETWIDGELCGGLYGLAIGKMFFGESMFHHVSDASKLAFVHLVQHLHASGVGMIDCQMKTAHLASLGAREISRQLFLKQLQELLV